MMQANIDPNIIPAVPAKEPERENHKAPKGTTNKTAKVVMDVPSDAKIYGGPDTGSEFPGNGIWE